MGPTLRRAEEQGCSTGFHCQVIPCVTTQGHLRPPDPPVRQGPFPKNVRLCKHPHSICTSSDIGTDEDFDAPVLLPAFRRAVGGDGLRFPPSLGPNAGLRDALADKNIGDSLCAAF